MTSRLVYDPFVDVPEIQTAINKIWEASSSSEKVRLCISGPHGCGKDHLMSELGHLGINTDSMEIWEAETLNKFIIECRKRSIRRQYQEKKVPSREEQIENTVNDRILVLRNIDTADFNRLTYEEWKRIIARNKIFVTSSIPMSKMEQSLSDLLLGFEEVKISPLSIESKRAVIESFVKRYQILIEPKVCNTLLQIMEDLDEIKEFLWRLQPDEINGKNIIDLMRNDEILGHEGKAINLVKHMTLEL